MDQKCKARGRGLSSMQRPQTLHGAKTMHSIIYLTSSIPKKSADFSGAPLHFSRSAGSARLRVRRHRPAFRIVSAGRIRCFPKKSADFSGTPFLFQTYYIIPTGKRKTFACAALRRLKQKGEAPYLSLSGARGATHTFPHLWGSSFIHALPFWRSLHSAHAPAPPLWQTAPLHCQGM